MQVYHDCDTLELGESLSTFRLCRRSRLRPRLLLAVDIYDLSQYHEKLDRVVVFRTKDDYRTLDGVVVRDEYCVC